MNDIIIHDLLSKNLLILYVSILSVGFVTSRFRRPRSVSISDPGKVVEPPMIASWLPWIGSGFDYMSRPLTFLRHYDEQYGSVFKFKLFGHTYVAISSPTAVSNLFQDHTGSFDFINGQNIYRLGGIKTSQDRVPIIFSALEQKAVPPIHRALMPSRLHVISARLTEELLKVLKQSDLKNHRISLNDFVHRTLYNAASIAFLGSKFPLDTYENFMIFDDGAALQLRQLGAFSKAANAARESIVACYTRYFVEQWVSQRDGYLEGATDMMSDIYRGLKESGLSQDEIHRVMLALLWALHGNVMELTTWAMCHILTDSDIYTRVCNEIRDFAGEFTKIEDIAQIDPRLLDGDAFCFLSSVVQEVMRTKTALGQLREATSDAVVMDDNDRKIYIRKGEIIVANLPGMHHSSSLQKEPDVFKADRFINGATYSSYIFGGGKHICPGRSYAKFAVRQFIILTLALYDIQLQSDPVSPSRSLPEPDGAMGLKLMFFSRRKNDLSIRLCPTPASV